MNMPDDNYFRFASLYVLSSEISTFSQYICSKSNDGCLYIIPVTDSSNRSQQWNIGLIISHHIEKITIRHFSTSWCADHFDIDWLPIDLSVIPY